jgi:hypothetical protein
LPGTQPLEWPEEDLSERLMDGAHQFVDRQIAEASRNRGRYWPGSLDSDAAREMMIQENRAVLREIIGATDVRHPPSLERFGDDAAPALVSETDQYQVFQVRWPVTSEVEAIGLWVRPAGTIRGCVAAVPDADQIPEQLLGLAPGIPAAGQWARRLAEAGFELLLPTLVTRQPLETDDPAIQQSDQSEREWIYRQAFHMGRHIIGFEVQKVLAAVDVFEQRHGPDTPVGVAGYAEGGLIAFYAAALDRRIDAALVSGYFGSRERVWSEPIYRNLWSFLKRFGDAEIAALV